MRVFSIVDEEMNEGEPSKSDIWKSKAPTDVAMETLPASHVVNTLLQVLIEPMHEIFNNVACATSKASVQPAH